MAPIRLSTDAARRDYGDPAGFKTCSARCARLTQTSRRTLATRTTGITATAMRAWRWPSSTVDSKPANRDRHSIEIGLRRATRLAAPGVRSSRYLLLTVRRAAAEAWRRRASSADWQRRRNGGAVPVFARALPSMIWPASRPAGAAGTVRVTRTSGPTRRTVMDCRRIAAHVSAQSTGAAGSRSGSSKSATGGRGAAGRLEGLLTAL